MRMDEIAVASNNSLGLVNAGNNTINVNKAQKQRKEPFILASIRAKLDARAEEHYLDFAISQVQKIEESNTDEAAKRALVATVTASFAHNLNVEAVVQCSTRF